MNLVAYLVRADLRRRWRTLLVLGLLLGVVVGGAMWAVAGARRTATSYERLLAATNTEDVLVNPDDGYADFDAIEALPQVRDACRATGAPLAIEGPDGEPDFEGPFLPFLSDGRCLFDLSGPARVDGRLPDPSEPYEVFLSASAAQTLGYGRGDTISAFAFADEEAPPEPIELTVTGVGVYGQDALLDPENTATFPVMLLTPAYGDAHPFDVQATFTGSLVQLEHGEADMAAFNAAAIDAAGESLHLEDRFENERKAGRALEPYALALRLFALGVLVAGIGMAGGALHRTLSSNPADHRTLASLGVAPVLQSLVPLALALVVGSLAAVVGTTLAIALSPIAPIGPAHDIEPDPGLHTDGWVLALGATGMLLVAAAVGLLAAVALRRAERVGAEERASRPSLLSRAGLGLRAPSSAGLRLATGEIGSSRSGALTTFVGATLGVIAVLVVQVVGAGIVRLIDTPARYGWAWDAMVSVAEEDFTQAEGPSYRSTVAQLDDLGVAGRQTINLGQVDVAGLTVAAVGLGDAEGEAVGPPTIGGRLPADDDEVALGATTMHRGGVDLGDDVTIRSGGERRRLRVVGTVTFPRLTEYPGAPNTGLGDGALLTSEALVELTGALPYSGILVRAGDGDRLAALQSAFPQFSSSADNGFVTLIERPQRPDALFGYESTTPLRYGLGGLLGGLTVASVALGLSASVRAARREIAVLRAIGFTPGQSRHVVRVHGLVVAGVALVLGVPLGLAAGRAAWRSFADRLGVASDPITPGAGVAVTALVVVAVCVLLTIPIAAGATRSGPAAALRAE